MQPSRRRRQFTIALRLAVTLGLLALILWKVPLAEIAGALRSADPTFWVPAFLIALFGPLLSSWRLLLLTRAQRLPHSPGELVRINYLTQLYGLTLPGPVAGGGVRWYLLARGGRSRERTLAAVALARLTFLSTLVGLGVLFLVLDAARTRQAPALLPILLALGLGLLAGIVFLWQADRLPLVARLRRRRPDSLAARLAAAASFNRNLSLREMSLVLALATAENLISALSTYWLARAVQAPVGFITIAWIRSVVQALTNLPLTVAGLGVREGLLVVLLKPYGVPSPVALAVSLLILARQLAAAILGGIVAAAASGADAERQPGESLDAPAEANRREAGRDRRLRGQGPRPPRGGA